MRQRVRSREAGIAKGGKLLRNPPPKGGMVVRKPPIRGGMLVRNLLLTGP